MKAIDILSIGVLGFSFLSTGAKAQEVAVEEVVNPIAIQFGQLVQQRNESGARVSMGNLIRSPHLSRATSEQWNSAAERVQAGLQKYKSLANLENTLSFSEGSSAADASVLTHFLNSNKKGQRRNATPVNLAIESDRSAAALSAISQLDDEQRAFVKSLLDQGSHVLVEQKPILNDQNMMSFRAPQLPGIRFRSQTLRVMEGEEEKMIRQTRELVSFDIDTPSFVRYRVIKVEDLKPADLATNSAYESPEVIVNNMDQAVKALEKIQPKAYDWDRVQEQLNRADVKKFLSRVRASLESLKLESPEGEEVGIESETQSVFDLLGESC
jgi:hypothetical protein